MENIVEPASEAPSLPLADVDEPTENMVQLNVHNGEAKENLHISPEEMRSMLEVIAATGKFWHDWSLLRKVLSSQLKQVTAEYPESQPVGDALSQQRSLLGETHSDLLRRLNEALLAFEEGPPFTLQRICEILLYPKMTYTKFAKLAFALEKNLLVTSTLTKCTEPYPSATAASTERAVVANRNSDEFVQTSTCIPNGVETVDGNADEEMTDAEVYEDAVSQDAEMQEDEPDLSDGAATVTDSSLASLQR